MIFYATLRAGSCIDRLWRQTNRRSGKISGVMFRRRGGVFESAGPLDPEDVDNLKSHPDVRLEISGIAVAGEPDTDDPAQEDKEIVAEVEATTKAGKSQDGNKGTKKTPIKGA